MCRGKKVQPRLHVRLRQKSSAAPPCASAAKKSSAAPHVPQQKVQPRPHVHSQNVPAALLRCFAAIFAHLVGAQSM